MSSPFPGDLKVAKQRIQCALERWYRKQLRFAKTVDGQFAFRFVGWWVVVIGFSFLVLGTAASFGVRAFGLVLYALGGAIVEWAKAQKPSDGEWLDD